MTERICAYCGGPLRANSPRAIVCGQPECREARRRARNAGLPGVLPPEQRQCVVCGNEFRADRNMVCCSDECLTVKQRQRYREKYYQRKAADPNYTRQVMQRRKERVAADPEYAEKVQGWEKERQRRTQEKLRADPEYAERVRARARAWYAQHAERIQQERREKLQYLTEDELRLRHQRMKAYQRRYQAKKRQRGGSPAGNKKRRNVLLEMEALREELASRLEQPTQSKPCAVCGQPIVGRRSTAVVCGRSECQVQRHRQLYPPRQREKGCRTCGVKFREGFSGKFCSEPCYRDWLGRKRPEQRTCTVCGTVFRPHNQHQMDCSPDCQRTGRARRRKEREALPPLPPRPCAICTGEFVPSKKTQRLCGQPGCTAEYKRRRANAVTAGAAPLGNATCVCSVCGRDFQGHSNSKVCSRECRLERNNRLSRARVGSGPYVCRVCGVEIDGSREQRYTCSPVCSQELLRRKRRRAYLNQRGKQHDDRTHSEPGETSPGAPENDHGATPGGTGQEPPPDRSEHPGDSLDREGTGGAG